MTSGNTGGRIQAVIFDMDGLLFDSEILWERARRTYCEELGCSWSEHLEQSVKGANSREWATVIEATCAAAGPPEHIIREVSEGMKRLYAEDLPLLPGAVKAVNAMAEAYPVAVASSSPLEVIRFALSESGLLARFASITSADEVRRGKPHPDVFLEAARRLGVAANRTAVFEDSAAGVAAARAAGAYVIAVPNRHSPFTSIAREQADVVLGSLSELDAASVRGVKLETQAVDG